MALAILRFQGVEGDRALFHLEAGANRWYAVAVGGGEADRTHGFSVRARSQSNHRPAPTWRK